MGFCLAQTHSCRLPPTWMPSPFSSPEVRAMAYDIRSISQVGTSEPFELQLARGQIPGHHFRHVLGAVPAMSQNQSGTIWDVNDTNYPWSAFADAGTLS